MTAEFFFYLILIFFTVMFSCVKINRYLYIVISLTIFSAYSLAVRLSGFDIDMIVYADSLKYDSLSIYYLKEPVYWFSSRYLYQLVNNDALVFFIYDMLSFIILLVAQAKLGMPRFFALAVIVFFPSVLGLQNVYRQYLSIIIFLLAMGYAYDNKNKSSYLTFLIAGLTHNVAFVFFPLLLVIKKAPNWQFYLSTIVILAFLPIALSTKSSSESGELSPQIYIFVQLVLFGCYILITKGHFNKEKVNWFLWNVFFLLLLFISVVFTGGTQSKRVGMLCFVLSLIPLIKMIDIRFKNVLFVRVVFILLLAAPTFIFKNALLMLNTAGS